MLKRVIHYLCTCVEDQNVLLSNWLIKFDQQGKSHTVRDVI